MRRERRSRHGPQPRPDESAPATEKTHTPAATSTPEPARPRFGVAGLVPRNHPNPNDDNWRALFDSYSETGELVGA